jgi:formamidopyrimidine-DNA glycosylase
MGMSGSLTVHPFQSTRAKHVHVHWTLMKGDKKFELHHKDPRRFGYVQPFFSIQEIRNDIWSTLGLDALCITADDLLQKFKNKKRSIKASLLDQACVAGVGNIYADETLFQSGIHPLRNAGSISLTELEKMIKRLRIILNRSIQGGGSSIQDHQDACGRAGTFQNCHLVYGRGGEPCEICGSILKQTICAQRTTVFCSACQPRNK